MFHFLFSVTKLGEETDSVDKTTNGKNRNRTNSEGHLKSVGKRSAKRRHRSVTATESTENLKRLTTMFPQKKPKGHPVVEAVKPMNGECLNGVGDNSCESSDTAKQQLDDTSDVVQSAALSLLQLVKEGSQFGLDSVMDSVSDQVSVDDRDDTDGDLTGDTDRILSVTTGDDDDSIDMEQQQQQSDECSLEDDTDMQDMSTTPEWVKKHQSSRKPLVQCRICRLKLKDYRYLFKHLKSRHSDHKDLQTCLEEVQPKQRVPCPICKMPVPANENLSSHIRQCHLPSAPADISCATCKLSLPNQVALQLHVKKCERRRYSCSKCTTTFSAKGCLEEHMNIDHGVDAILICDSCHKAFTSRSLLKRHKCRRYNHFCSHCDRGFMWKQTLVKHTKSAHETSVAGKTLFQCPSCDRSFCIEGNLMQHIREAHALPFTCSTCNKSFRGRSELHEHSCVLFLSNM